MPLRLPAAIILPAPHRGRALRTYFRKLPAGRAFLDRYYRLRASQIGASGARALAEGRKEGRRFLTAIPHALCGIGHAFSEWNTAYQWAGLLGMDHANIPLRDDWNAYLGLEGITDTCAEVLKRHTPLIVRLPYAPWSRGANAFPAIKSEIERIRTDRNLLFILADAQNAYDHTSQARHLQERFFSRGLHHALPRHAEEGCLNVAIHVRRGDIVQMVASDTGDWRERLVGEDYFCRISNLIKEHTPDRRIVFHIYSQGQIEDFPQLRALNGARFHLDASEQESLLNMALADILILSPSGFSYLGALLSRGLKIARHPWWHYYPDDPDWFLVVDNGTNVDQMKFLNKLKYISQK